MRSHDQRNVDFEWLNATPVALAPSVRFSGVCHFGLREER